MNISPNPTARLFLNTAGNRRAVPIASIPFTIGRGADRSLPLGHPQVSRDHARIERDGSGYILCDAGSRHGTFVNGSRVTSTRLHSADTISFGASPDTLVFEDDEESTTRSLLTQISQARSSPLGENDLEKLSLFLKAAQSLSSFGAINDVLCTMLEHTISLTGAERGFVFLGDTAESLRLECGQTRDGEPIREHPSISYSVLLDAARSQLDFILTDVTEDMARGRDSLIANAIRSVVAIPLRSQNSSLLGLLYLDSHFRTHFNRTGEDILHAIARQAATLLENLRLLESERESAFLRKELEIAASIQRQIIPETLPEFPFARLCARTVPCTGVGGDFYDVIPTPGGFVAIVADVCGKGVPAALLASMVQGMVHGQVGLRTASGASLAEVVQSLNSFVCSRAPKEKYVTLAVLRYTHSGSGDAIVELVNGGHVAPMIVRADGRLETVDDGDMPVGLLDFARFHTIPITLAVGDRIVLLSDGITEAEDPAGHQFGVHRLEPHLTHPDPVTSLFAAMHLFCQGTRALDDQTVFSIDRIA